MTINTVNPSSQQQGATWPSGFRANPAAMMLSGQTWRAVAWVFVLGVIALPLWIISMIMLPWLPLLARIVDGMGHRVAHWMGVPTTPRVINKWFDWQQTVQLIVHLILSAVALLVVGSAWLFFGFCLAIPFIFFFTDSLAELSINEWSTQWAPAVVGVSLGLALVGLLVAVYVSWIVAGVSVYSTTASNISTEADVERLTQSRQVLLDAFTGERQRIERELHDGAQQYLTALQLNIATARLSSRSAEDTPPELEEALAHATANANKALESLRSTIRGILPQVLVDRGLVAALEELSAHSSLNVQVTSSQQATAEPLNTTYALLLYHCASEALTNAIRHAQAHAVHVELKVEDRGVEITIDDDGHGLDGTSGESGTGINGLRERAAALNGTVTLQPSTLLSGAQLRMELPR